MKKFLTTTLILWAVLLSSPPANANETVGNNYGSQAVPAVIGEYSRHDSFMEVTRNSALPPECSQATVSCHGFTVASSSAVVRCNGGGGSNGGWAVDSVSGNCYNAFTMCFGSGTPVQTCYNIPADPLDPGDVSFGPYSNCSSATFDTPAAKRYCVHNHAGAVGITGNTGDDMFRIERPANAFFEYERVGPLSNPDRLRWIERTGGPANAVMMPSGPAVGDYSDYERFLDNASPSIVNVDPACYPVNIGTCGAGIPMPAVAGACGAADGGFYESLSEIPTSAFCYIGDPVNKAEDSTQITWNCSGFSGGGDSGQCSALKSSDGMCGSANGSEFSSLESLKNAELCAGGALVAMPDGASPWTWTCGPVGPGGTSAQCFAFDSTSCEDFFTNKNMVLVQDTSESFKDDFPHIRLGLEQLFNNPLFDDWRVGLTEFSTALSGGYDKTLNFTRVAPGRGSIDSVIAGYNATGSEDPFVGLYLAASDFFPDPIHGAYTLVLITDEPDGGSVETDPGVGNGQISWFMQSAANLIKANDLRLVVLTTSDNMGFYQNYLSDYNVPGEVQVITSDSSNFAHALMQGLTRVRCN